MFYKFGRSNGSVTDTTAPPRHNPQPTMVLQAMSGELHEISAAIGELRGEVRAANAQRAEINRKLDAVVRKLDGLSPMVARLDRIEPMVDEHERVNQRAVGFHAALGIGGGVAGSGLVAGALALARKMGLW